MQRVTCDTKDSLMREVTMVLLPTLSALGGQQAGPEGEFAVRTIAYE